MSFNKTYNMIEGNKSWKNVYTSKIVKFQKSSSACVICASTTQLLMHHLPSWNNNTSSDLKNYFEDRYTSFSSIQGINKMDTNKIYKYSAYMHVKKEECFHS